MCRIKVVQNGAGGQRTVADVLVAKCPDVTRVYGRQKMLSEGFIRVVILMEDGFGDGMSVVKFGDLCGGRAGRDNGRGARVDGSEKNCGRQGVVDGKSEG